MPDNRLHDTDFNTWAVNQAEALRYAAQGQRSNAVDWENVIEEIESLGNEQEHVLESHLRNVMVHLLKLEFSPATNPRDHWMEEVGQQRVESEARLRRNPGLKPKLPGLLADSYRYGRKLAALRLQRDGLTLADLPEDCPYTLDQVRDFDWFPVRPADGVKD